MFLTSVGGGAFGNRSMWIESALRRALLQFKAAPLDVRLVFYRMPAKGAFEGLAKEFGSKPGGKSSSAKK